MNQNLSKHMPGHKLEVLQRTVRRSDTIRGNITVIRAEDNGGKFTIGEHDPDATRLGPLTLVILDAQGNGTPPDGTAIVVKGTAWIENVKKNVGVAR